MSGRYGASRQAGESATHVWESISRRGKRQVPLGRQDSTHLPPATFARNNLLMFPLRHSLRRAAEWRVKGGCGPGLISNFAGLLIKTHRPTLTVMLARKCSFPRLHRPRYTLGGRVTYVRNAARYLWPCHNFPRTLPRTAVREEPVALHLSFPREGKSRAVE